MLPSEISKSIVQRIPSFSVETNQRARKVYQNYIVVATNWFFFVWKQSSWQPKIKRRSCLWTYHFLNCTVFLLNFFKLYLCIDDTIHLNLCKINAYISVILARYSCDYEMRIIQYSGCMKFSGRNWTENSEMIEFISFKFFKFQTITVHKFQKF